MSEPRRCRCGAIYGDPDNPYEAIHKASCEAPERHYGYCGDNDCMGPCQHCGGCTHGTAHDDGVTGTKDLTCTLCHASYWT